MSSNEINSIFNIIFKIILDYINGNPKCLSCKCSSFNPDNKGICRTCHHSHASNNNIFVNTNIPSSTSTHINPLQSPNYVNNISEIQSGSGIKY